MEHCLNDIWMDVQGCELSTANAHQQIQRVEEEIKEELHRMKRHFEESEGKQYLWGSGVQEKVDTTEERMGRQEQLFGNLLHFVNNREDTTKTFKDVVDAQARFMTELKERINSQEVTITALKDRVGKLELGRRLLRNRIIAIEVGR